MDTAQSRDVTCAHKKRVGLKDFVALHNRVHVSLSQQKGGLVVSVLKEVRYLSHMIVILAA